MTYLTEHEKTRFKHHLKISEIGENGQVKLKNSRVLCIGAGGLGSPLLLYLAASGIGTIGIADDDIVQLDNLHRQVLYNHKHINHKKIDIAQDHLQLLNENINIIKYPMKICSNNAADLFNQYDIIADCSDNFITRYLVSEVCFKLNKPYVYASVLKFKGQCSTFLGNDTPCFRCLYPNREQVISLNENGVLGMLPGILGTIQATEIIKWILEFGELLTGRLLTVDVLKMQFREFGYSKNPECRVCA